MKRWARSLTAAIGVLLVVVGIAVAARAATADAAPATMASDSR
jgi:hypothetical protein